VISTASRPAMGSPGTGVSGSAIAPSSVVFSWSRRSATTRWLAVEQPES